MRQNLNELLSDFDFTIVELVLLKVNGANMAKPNRDRFKPLPPLVIGKPSVMIHKLHSFIHISNW